MPRNDAEEEFDGVDVERAVDELGSDTLLDTLDDETIESYVTKHEIAVATGA